MIKKMILEEAREKNKALTLVDVDFSKAYDSTERFAKEMTLRRMGFPERALIFGCALTTHGACTC